MTIQHDGKTLTPTQDAWLTGGTVYLDGGAQFNGPRYQQSAKDAEGNEYTLYWFDPSTSEDGDESNACDWGSPDFIHAL